MYIYRERERQRERERKHGSISLLVYVGEWGLGNGKWRNRWLVTYCMMIFGDFSSAELCVGD